MSKNGAILWVFFSVFAILFQIIVIINIIEKNNKKNKFETKYEIIKNMNAVVDGDTIKVIGKLDDVEFVFLSNGKTIHIDSVTNYFSVK